MGVFGLRNALIADYSSFAERFFNIRDERIAVNVINHLGDEVMKVFRVE